MTGDIAQSIRQIVLTAMGMPADSVRPVGQNQGAGAGTQIQHLATVEIIDESDLGWPAISTENTDDTAASTVTEHVDQLKLITASVNFYRGGNADASGIASYTTSAMDDASRLAQRLRQSATADLIRSLGLVFIDASKPRNLSAIRGSLWESRGQVDLQFCVVNRESSEIPSIGSGSVNVTVDSKTIHVEVTP